MEVSLSLHPLEVARHLRCFTRDLQLDLETRFEDVRKRQILEVTYSGNLATTIIPEADFRGTVSIFNWRFLFEWNERWLQARTLIEVSDYITLAASKPDHRLARSLGRRLEAIRERILTHPLSDHPSWLELLSFRWEFTALRHECNYLMDRLDSLLE